MEISNELMICKLLVIHPWAQTMEYFIDIAQRAREVKKHSFTECYAGPDWGTTGSFMLLNFKTGRLVSGKEHVMLHEMPVNRT